MVSDQSDMRVRCRERIFFTDVSGAISALIDSFSCFIISKFSELGSYRCLCFGFDLYMQPGHHPWNWQRVHMLFALVITGLTEITDTVKRGISVSGSQNSRGLILQVGKVDKTNLTILPACWFTADQNDLHFLTIYIQRVG